MAPLPPSPPALLEATKNSTSVWQFNLGSLFLQAKDRFPDVVWELGQEDDKGKGVEEVWGHKAIVYARAPPSFQARYFQFRPAPIASPIPYSSSPTGTLSAQSSLSLSIGLDVPLVSRSPSPFRPTSPSPSTTPGTLLRLNTSINPILFSNELEYLYTGKGFGEAFEFLFDTSESREEGDAEENRIDKLRKDLVFMWRSRLYSDVSIALSGNFSSSNHQYTTAIFSSHRFILVSRSPYFHDALVSWDTSTKLVEPLTLTLPSPPFTPASLHFTLGFIYTGTLIFSHRTYDLDTALHIMSSAAYLSIDTLYDEIQARIVQEMMHGLFHAFLEFPEYERITGGKWGTGGCRCRQCARRAPRVLEFSMSNDVKNPHLERGARRALVGLFGEGWCTSEFANLPQRIKDSLLKGLAKRTTPQNVFPLLFATQHAMNKLGAVIDAWAELSREMILAARKTIDDVLCSKSDECFEQPEWLQVMEADGVRFEDGEKVEWVMDAVRRGLTEKNAPMLYQTLVSSILLRPHATDTDATLLPPTSHIRVQVEEVRMDVLRWIGKRWVSIRQESGFDPLEGWAIKEISGEIEVPVEDLFSPSQLPPKGPHSKIASKLNNLDAESDSISLRASVLRGNTGRRNVTPTRDPSLMSSVSSVKLVARSVHSTASRASTAAPSRRGQPPPGPRPDSKLTPSTMASSARSSTTESVTPSLPKTTISKLSPSVTSTRRPISAKSSSPNADRSDRSVTPSVRSHASTVRNGGAAGPSTLRPSSAVSRPNSTLSTTTDGSTTFKTANSERYSSMTSRSRKTSGASTVSNVVVNPTTPSTPQINRPRRLSAASATSTLSSATKTKRPSTMDTSKLIPPAMDSRSLSGTSVRSTASISSSTGQKVLLRKPASMEKPALLSPKTNGRPTSGGAVSMKGKSRTSALASSDKMSHRDSTGSVSTINGGLKRKGSGDTITKMNLVADKASLSPLKEPLTTCPRGATLDIGIPCIISSKRKRFKAFARYIGEVEGELGPWVGVEVPVGDNWTGDKLEEGRQWNDGTWGGIRYFEIGGAGSEWDYGDDRAARRRRIDMVNSNQGLKRAGDHLSVGRAKRFRRSPSPTASDISTSESRGLFVRPQQVLYVVDAVGSDLYEQDS